ncbi:MAG: ATP-binding protein [Lachnospiraceae bacterium]|nr:ATP-binding protein [Lachnospiraceae bacterium]
MDNKIIIIQGYLAAGKSVFAERLSQALQIPCLIKDTFKTALCNTVPIEDRKMSSRFSAVTFDGMLYVAEKLLEVGCPLMLEGNFVPAGVKDRDEAEAIRTLLEKYQAVSLTFKFKGDTHVLHRRFAEREKLPERGQANRIGSQVLYEDFDKWCHNMDSFDIGGKIIQIDTTDFALVDYEEMIQEARQFMEGKGRS